MQNKHPRQILEIRMEVLPQSCLDLNNQQQLFIDTEAAGRVLSLATVSKAIATLACQMNSSTERKKGSRDVVAGISFKSIGAGKNSTSFSVVISSRAADSETANLIKEGFMTTSEATATLFAAGCNLHGTIIECLNEYRLLPEIKVASNVDKFSVVRSIDANEILIGSKNVAKAMRNINDLKGARSGIELKIGDTLHNRGPWINLRKPPILEDTVDRVSFSAKKHDDDGMLIGSYTASGKKTDCSLRFPSKLNHVIRAAYGPGGGLDLNVRWYKRDDIYDMFCSHHVAGEILGISDNPGIFDQN